MDLIVVASSCPKDLLPMTAEGSVPCDLSVMSFSSESRSIGQY
ncbi:hypothetical protein [Paracoccus tegillarcae]|nr:hypothetical protein [Paracoccus tegillarcae]